MSQHLALYSEFSGRCLSPPTPLQGGRFRSRERSGRVLLDDNMGQGTEVGKHETCVEINEEPGLSGKRGSCQGTVGDEAGRWAGMLHFPGRPGGHNCHSLQKGRGRDWASEETLLCGLWWDGGGWAGGCGHPLVFLSSFLSFPVLYNWELGEVEVRSRV